MAETEIMVDMGAGRSRVSRLPYHALPWGALREVVTVFQEGIDEYKDRVANALNLEPLRSQDFVTERANHAVEHLALWIEGDRSAKHLAKVAWFCLMAIAGELAGIDVRARPLRRVSEDAGTSGDCATVKSGPVEGHPEGVFDLSKPCVLAPGATYVYGGATYEVVDPNGVVVQGEAEVRYAITEGRLRAFTRRA